MKLEARRPIMKIAEIVAKIPNPGIGIPSILRKIVSRPVNAHKSIKTVTRMGTQINKPLRKYFTIVLILRLLKDFFS
jgi:hypothetical protein